MVGRFEGKSQLETNKKIFPIVKGGPDQKSLRSTDITDEGLCYPLGGSISCSVTADGRGGVWPTAM